MITEQIEQIEINQNDKLESMTTVIAIKCQEGIVIASDSQATSPWTKNIEVSKIFKINDSIGIGASGNEAQIKLLVEELRQSLGEEEFDSEPKLRKRINDILSYLHRKHSVEQSTNLGYQNTFLLFNPSALIGAKLSGGSFCLYNISFLPSSPYAPPHPFIDSLDNYQTIGSGFPLANLVLTQQSRIPKLEQKKLSDLDLIYNIWIASYTINEVKAVEPNTGGNTNVVIINKDGYREISDEEQKEFYNKTIGIISTELEKRILDEKSKMKLEDLFPKN